MTNIAVPACLLALGLAIGPARAEPATPEGAKAIEQGYARYFGRTLLERAIVSIAPRGDDYVATLDLQKALELLDVPAKGLRAEAFALAMTPMAGGAWKVKADHWPAIALDMPTSSGHINGAIEARDFRFDQVYDPNRPDFLASALTLGGLDATAHIRDADAAAPAAIEVRQGAMAVATRATTAPGGAIDVALKQTSGEFAERVDMRGKAGPEAQDAGNLTYSYKTATMDVAIDGLHARAIDALWRWLAARGAADLAPADREELRAMLRDLAPVWDNFQLGATIQDISYDMALGHVGMKALTQTLRASGLTAHGDYGFGVKLDRLTVKSALLPSWISALTPASLDLDLNFAIAGLDEAARVAIDELDVGGKEPVSPATADRLRAILLAGAPKLSLAPGRFTTPTLDLAFEGELAIAKPAPAGHFKISADSLDRTLALLQTLGQDGAEMQGAMLGVTYLKGLATTGPDGRLVWLIAVGADGEVTVNGTPMPRGK